MRGGGTRGTRRHWLAALTIVAALIAFTVAEVGTAVASGASAQVAKKKCTKKKRKKHKCGKKVAPAPATNDIAQATALFSGSRFYSTGCTSTQNCNRSYTRLIDFCPTSRFNARFELNDSITGNTFVDRLSGTWKFTAANIAAGSGTIAITIDQQTSDAGTTYPSSGNSQVQASSQTSFNFDGSEYTRTPGGAQC